MFLYLCHGIERLLCLQISFSTLNNTKKNLVFVHSALTVSHDYATLAQVTQVKYR